MAHFEERASSGLERDVDKLVPQATIVIEDSGENREADIDRQ